MTVAEFLELIAADLDLMVKFKVSPKLAIGSLEYLSDFQKSDLLERLNDSLIAEEVPPIPTFTVYSVQLHHSDFDPNAYFVWRDRKLFIRQVPNLVLNGYQSVDNSITGMIDFEDKSLCFCLHKIESESPIQVSRNVILDAGPRSGLKPGSSVDDVTFNAEGEIVYFHLGELSINSTPLDEKKGLEGLIDLRNGTMSLSVLNL